MDSDDQKEPIEGSVVEESGQALPAVTAPVQTAVSVIAAKEERFMGLMEIAVKEGKIAELEKIMDLQDRWEAKEAKKAFYDALAGFQSMIPTIPRRGEVRYETDGANGPGVTEFKFGRLEDAAKAIRPALEKTGLSYRFTQSNSSGAITVGCVVTHRAGHSETLEMVSNADTSGKKNAIQAIASAVSYMRRYTFTGSFGITFEGEDNDAQDYQEAAAEPDYMPDSQFDGGFPKWQQLILEGKKTADDIITFINSKGGYLSQPQLDTINKVGKTQ